MSTKQNLKGMNVVLFITDQERAIQHFPPDWEKANLPGLKRLKYNGLTFERAFCNSCMCSPSRATLMTGFFPAQHGVKWTLEEDMPGNQYPQQELPPSFANIASVMQAAGYSTPYKGKFHLTKPHDEKNIYTPADLARYGFQRWNPTDAGADQNPEVYGGGDADHDSRYMHDCRLMEAGNEGVLAYLKYYAGNDAADKQPFFLIVSLVNPHDVLGYPGNSGALDKSAMANGYDPSWLRGSIELPLTRWESLDNKPSVQKKFLQLTNAGLGQFHSEDEERNYINFYGNLMRSSDGYLVRMLDLLEQLGLTQNTLIIRTADHGELALTHGGMRQKSFNFYEESTRVPLVYSTPKLFPGPVTTKALVSHVDFLPTLASLFDAPEHARKKWGGKDYSPLVLNPNGQSIQPYVVFTFDDFQSGQKTGPYLRQNSHLISVREEKYKLAKYYTANDLDVEPDPKIEPEWEMYDLHADPQEVRNITWPGAERTPEEESEFKRLRKLIEHVTENRLQPIAQTPPPPPPEVFKAHPPQPSSASQ
jgi:arylsulfatase A-like enzyme